MKKAHAISSREEKKQSLGFGRERSKGGNKLGLVKVDLLKDSSLKLMS